MKPLDGIIVLDLSRRYPGAYAGMVMADFGARVIRVDPPGSVLPHLDIDTTSERFAASYALDRNKQSIILNLRDDIGREAFFRLVQKADVLIEGFRPGAMARVGAGYEKLNKLNPRLIYCALTGYGQTGPYANVPGHDMNYIALAGALSLVGPKDGPPCFPSNLLADIAGSAMNGVIGILLALAAREKTGRGQFIDISYMDGALSLLAMDASFYSISGKVPKRGETPFTGGCTSVQVLKCKDGEYFTIACLEAPFWVNLCNAIGRHDLIPYHVPDEDKKEWVLAELQKVFLSHTRDEWWQILKDKETCVAPVHYMNEVFADPHVLSREMIVEMEHPKLGKVKQLGIPIKLSDTPGKAWKLGSQNGADTNEVLKWVGYDANETESMRRSGAVG